jgi:acyl-CoA reductase-like NAD-dependent aldehyde dehydrogenase
MATIERPTTYAPPGQPDSPVPLQDRYDNFIGGAWVPPEDGEYRENLSPATGDPFCEVASSTPADVELALDAAHAAKDRWGATSATDRAAVLNAMADAIEANLEMLAVAESWENGKPVRETLTPTCRSRSITCATSPARSAAKRAGSPSSTRRRWPITSRSRSAWSARSSPSTSRC